MLRKKATACPPSDNNTNKKKILTIKQRLAIQAQKWKAKLPSRKRLPGSFFNQHTVEASKQLLGKILSIGGKEAFIVETESYRGQEDGDEAAHAFSRDPSLKSTKKVKESAKNEKAPQQESSNAPFIAFHHPGKIYVYQIYGIHHCMNIIVEPEGKPGCVLIRGVRDVQHGTLIDGPGRVCKYFNEMTKASHNGVVLNQKAEETKKDESSRNDCWIGEGVAVRPEDIKVTPRIGITKAVDFPWRFVINEQTDEE